MIAKPKIWILVLFTTFILAGGFWFFFIPCWNTFVDSKDPWNYAFQFNEAMPVKYESVINKQKIPFPETARPINLIFKTSFYVADCSQITEGMFEYNYKYSARILINGIECASLDKNLIRPSLVDEEEKNGRLAIYEHWRPKKIRLHQSVLKSCLKDGENTIMLIVNNTSDFHSVDLMNKPLLLKSKGIPSEASPLFKLQRPPKIFTHSRLPILTINSLNNVIPDEPKIDASLNIINNEGQKNCLSDSSLVYTIKVERRGNTSQSFSKKSYSLNVVDQKGLEQPSALLNLAESSKWVLYGPYADKSLIRNALTYTLYNEMGNYAPRFRFVDLVINNNYQGIYLLTEKIQISPNHLNISPLKFDSIQNFSGGYLLEIDRNKWSSNFPVKGDTSFQRIRYEAYSPKKEQLNASVINIMKMQFNSLETSIYYDSNITEHIDINSFVDYFIISEVSKNIDAYKFSTFIYNKDILNKTPKFYIGPIWDYNFAFGLATLNDGYNPKNYVFNNTNKSPFWWKKLMQNDTFRSQLNKRYIELRSTVLSNSNINQKIDSLSNICRQSADLNFKKWDVLKSTDCWPNYYLGKTYDDEIRYLKQWVEQRLLFMDQTLLKESQGF